MHRAKLIRCQILHDKPLSIGNHQFVETKNAQPEKEAVRSQATVHTETTDKASRL